MMMIIRRKELIKCLAFFVLFYGYWTQWPLENAIQSWAPFLCISILFHWEDLANIFRSWHSSWTWIHWGPRQEVILYTHTYTRVHFFFSLCRQCACSCIHLMIMMMVCRLHMRKKEKEWDVPVMGCLVAFHDSSLSFDFSTVIQTGRVFWNTPFERWKKEKILAMSPIWAHHYFAGKKGQDVILTSLSMCQRHRWPYVYVPCMHNLYNLVQPVIIGKIFSLVSLTWNAFFMFNYANFKFI